MALAAGVSILISFLFFAALMVGLLYFTKNIPDRGYVRISIQEEQNENETCEGGLSSNTLLDDTSSFVAPSFPH